MKPRYWSLAIVLILVNYIIFATLFTWLIEVDFSRGNLTRQAQPTFTPAPAQPFVIVPTPIPVTPAPSPTPTRVLDNPEANAPTENLPANPPQPAIQAQLIAPGPVNIRSGPGTDYEIIGTLNANTAMPIIGRNTDASWWQIKFADGTTGWVAAAVVSASNTTNVPLTEVSAQQSSSLKVQPAADTLPPQPQFEPAGWQAETNPDLTRFKGDIRDAGGNPVNGVSVRASCGDFSIISDPSGSVDNGWADGYYEITVDSKPVPCLWVLVIVDSRDGPNLSETIPAQVTEKASVIVANWRKNW
jgi:uncharacterized protein YraI